MPKFIQGDIVRLISKEHPYEMTVVKYVSNIYTAFSDKMSKKYNTPYVLLTDVLCTWEEDGVPKKKEYHENLLELVI